MELSNKASGVQGGRRPDTVTEGGLIVKKGAESSGKGREELTRGIGEFQRTRYPSI